MGATRLALFLVAMPALRYLDCRSKTDELRIWLDSLVEDRLGNGFEFIWTIDGIDLPPAVLRKIYVTNAQKLIFQGSGATPADGQKADQAEP